MNVTVTTVGGTSSTGAADQFAYVAAPTVAGVNPTGGVTTGGTSVIITGTGFTGATTVDFGSTAATTFTVNSATQITATDAAGSGVVNVTVSVVYGGTSATSTADHFSYVVAPAVSSVSPTSGSGVGSTSVVIKGTGFTGATAVDFGSSSATTFTVNSATQITATDPAGVGVVNVTVTVPVGGTSATSSADHYTYVATTQAYTWTGDGGNGLWTNFNNWSPDTGYPGETTSDTAAFNSASYPYSPVLNISVTIASLTVGTGNSATISLSEISNSTLTIGSSGLTFDGGTSGVLQLQGIGTSTGTLTVDNASNASSNGWLEVDSGANYTFSSISVPGVNGPANNVMHQDGGTLQSTGAMALGSVNGPATSYDFMAGGTLQVGTSLTIGGASGGTASVLYNSQVNMSGGTVTVGTTTQIGQLGSGNSASQNQLIMSGGSFTSTGALTLTPRENGAASLFMGGGGGSATVNAPSGITLGSESGGDSGTGSIYLGSGAELAAYKIVRDTASIRALARFTSTAARSRPLVRTRLISWVPAARRPAATALWAAPAPEMSPTSTPAAPPSIRKASTYPSIPPSNPTREPPGPAYRRSPWRLPAAAIRLRPPLPSTPPAAASRQPVMPR